MLTTPQIRARIVAAAALVLLHAAAAYAKDPALLALTADHFKETATVTDDPATGTTTISTERGFVQRSGPMRMVWNDEYLKGVIDRKTGQTSFRLCTLVIYSGRMRAYGTARFSTVDGMRTVAATDVHNSVENCAVGDCTYTERMEFPIEGDLLRQIAGGGAPGQASLWRYELLANSGPAYAGSLSSAEIAGFLAKVDATVNAVPVVKAIASKAALRHDLGIEGIPVAASAELPGRAGILIAAVASGSVAHQAGLITGDIVVEFDGHPIATLAELQAAVSASGAAQIPIKLYRGTSTLTVTARFGSELMH